MARSAKVTSIDVVATFSDALRRFQNVAATALDELSIEIDRAIDWLQHDRKGFWINEVRRGYERVTEARIVLQRAQTFRRMVDREPACVDEKRALDRARRRLREAEEKVDRVRHWSRVLERAVQEYGGASGQLAGWLEADLPKALAALGRMSAALESYVALQAEAESQPAAGAESAPPAEDAVEPAVAESSAEVRSPEDQPPEDQPPEDEEP